MLHTVCANNFVRSTAVEPATTVRRHLISYTTGTRVGRKRGYAAYWHKCRDTSVMLWHRRLGHITAQSVKNLAEEKGTGMVVKDSYLSVSNCDTCTLAKSKQQHHPTVARIAVTQPLEIVYTDLSGPISPASGAGNSYVAKFTDHHTRLKSVFFRSKKNKAIDTLINPKTW